jgi:DNA polymerase-3 subunit epsilon
MRQVVLDIETTGLDYKEGHKIIEIACLELSNYLPTGKTYQTFVNPEKESSIAAKEKHGISDDFLRDKKLFNEVVPDFLEFIKDSPIVAHNGIAFDIPFLNYELKFNKLNVITNQIVDTLILARKLFPGSPANLDALCRRFDIDLSLRKKHGALIDAKLLAKVYLELKGGQQPNLILESKEKKGEIEEVKIIKKEILKDRKFVLSSEEEEKHKNFIKNIKSPIWNLYN